ncbi:MAG: prephenate dehydratase [Actinomycetes bacterium]
MRVGYLGPAGTFSEQAMHESLELAGLDGEAEIVPLSTVHDVVSAVQEGIVDRAIAPIENSVEGGVNEVIDAIVHDAPDVSIIGEYVLEINPCLIAREGTELSAVTTVFSHPQPLAQCASFLRRELPDAKLEATSSTAAAVEQVLSSDLLAAAIASPTAAMHSGAVVLAESIVAHDLTRFIWLSRSVSEPPIEGKAGKSAIIFSGAGDGSPGWLLDCLSEFASRSINLTRIESRPARHELGQYIFLVDIDGRVDVPGPPADALAGLAGHCEQVRVLGSYPIQ